jgi:predicted small integral membrane protein
MKLVEMSWNGWVWLCAEFDNKLIWIKAICKVGERHRPGGG